MSEERLREILDGGLVQGLSVLESGEVGAVSEKRKNDFRGMVAPVVVPLFVRSFVTLGGCAMVMDVFVRLMCVAYALGQRDAIGEL